MKTRHILTYWKSILAAALLLPLGASAGFAPYPFSEGFETWINTNYWTLQGTWGPTWAAAHAGNNSLASNPWNPTYVPNEDSSAIVGVDLFGATRPVLTFWQINSFNPGQDYGFVEVSRDQGVTWTSLSAVTGLNSTNWQRVQIDLRADAGAQVLIRWRLLSDAVAQYAGWFIDDISVAEDTVAPVYPFHDSMDTPASGANWLASVWDQVSPGYQGTGMSWNAAIGDGPVPGLDLSACLTLVPMLNLGKAVNPKMSFWWAAGAQADNTIVAQVSTNGGGNWTSVWSWNSYPNNGAPWTYEQVELNPYIGVTNLALQFVAYQAPPGWAFNLDFSVDEVRVDEAPTDLAVSIAPGTDPRHDALLSWTASPDTNFAYYAIYRSTTPGVSPNNVLVTTISNQSVVSFQDTNLAVIARTYYYRVLVWNAVGLHNWGTNDVALTTIYGQTATNYPFSEGFESGNAHWAFDVPWAITPQFAHSGANSLGSNPGTNYASNTDASAYLSLDLSKANRPVLSFWELFAFQPNQDYGFVEVSKDQGANWASLYAVTGQGGSNWFKAQVPLDSYAGTQVLIRFRLLTSSGNAFFGWFIDDVLVQDLATVLPYPFSDNMDTPASRTNWLASAWQQYQNGVTTNGTDMSWRCLIGSGSVPGLPLNAYFTLAGGLNLSSASNPKLWFWWRAGAQSDNTMDAEVSTDGAKSWTSLWSWNSYPNNSAPWTRQQLDLQPYAGVTNLAVRFGAFQAPPGWAFDLDFSVDDVLIAEQPEPDPNVSASVAPGSDPRYDALLTWAASTAPDFAYYAIYRSTSPAPGTNNLLLVSITNRTTTSYVDTNMPAIGQTYYYAVLVWSTNGLADTGVGGLIYHPAFGQVATNYPFAEGFESGSTHWAFDQPWAISTEMSHSGANCLGSNPGTDYANNADSSAYLNLDLTKANRPLLTFWQRYSFEPNQDYGFVEISSNQGANWTRLYAVTSQSGTNWLQARIALDSYAGSQVILRFRLVSDAQNTATGWFIDDVQVQDFGVALGYPFFDSMDGPATQTNWAGSLWQQSPSTVTTNASDMCWRAQIGDNYVPGGDLAAYLTLAGTVDLSKSVIPKLSFWWRAGAQSDNTIYAEVSTNGGQTWQPPIWSWNSYPNSSAPWTWEQVDLDLQGYKGYANLGFRFLAYQEPPGWAFNLDFAVDDVRFDEGPAEVGLTVTPGADPRHDAQLVWTPSTSTNFSYYAIYRSTNPGFTPDNLLVTTISNRNTVSFQDTSLPLVGQTYYYRVFVWNTLDLHNEAANIMPYSAPLGQTVTNYPFAEGFETGDANWGLDRPWAITSQVADNGSYSLGFVPGTNYATYTDTSAYLNINLAGASRPILSFWQRYGFEPNRDYGFVEVSLDQGGTWTCLYAVTGSSDGAWTKVQVALDGFAASPLLIRFRAVSDGQTTYDGWFIDNVRVDDLPGLAMGYPFYDSVNQPNTLSNWVATTWQQTPGGALGAGDKSWRCQIGNETAAEIGCYCYLTLAGTVDLTGAVDPQLWFFWRAGPQSDNTLYAEVSTDVGGTWTPLWSWNSYPNNSAPWTRQQVDLSAYAGVTNLTIRFLAYQAPPGWAFGLDFSIDNVLIAPGGGVPAILTYSPLPNATEGFAYAQTLVATNGFLPYTWASLSNSLPSWLSLDPVAGILSGTPTNTGSYNFWLSVTTSNNLVWQKQFSLTVQDYIPVFPTHTAYAFVSPGTNAVYCQVANQTGNQLLSLVWAPTLPAGWSLAGVQGDGNPEIGPDGNILFEAPALTNNPLQFSYLVNVPVALTNAQQIYGAATFQLAGMANQQTIPAQPNPLLTTPRVYHSADCNTNWIIETSEANRVLADWRAQSYHTDPATCDGYAPGPGAENGPLQTADFEEPFWVLDGTEVNRVLAYWRAGCYQPNPTNVDGFSAGCAGPGVAPNPAVTRQLPPHYAPGTTFLVTNQLAYSGTLLSLLWRPILPAGWAATNILADGTPEFVNGEMVWTGPNLPPSPIRVLYFVSVPASEQAPTQQTRDYVEYQALGMINPDNAYAAPDPVTMSIQYIKFGGVQRLSGGTLQFQLSGVIDAQVRLQSAAALTGPWITLQTFPSLNGAVEFLATPSSHVPTQYYRLVSP